MAEYRKFSEDQIALANSVNLVDYLRHNGESLIKSGREFRWQRYTSVTIRDNKWYKHKSQEGGFPIKFLEEFYGYQYPDAVELLLSFAHDTGIAVNDNVQEKKEIKEFQLPPRNTDMRKAYAYLLKTRFIDKEIIDVFVKAGLIYEDADYHNVVFVGADEDGIARYAHKKSTYTKSERSYRGNVEASDPRYSFHFKGTSNQLYVFEAPIDMLSYISLHKDNWQQHSYVALCGLGMQAMETMLEVNSNLQSVILGADHDIAGSEGIERMRDHLQEMGYQMIAVAQPKYKDFNEDLKAVHGLTPQEGVENPKYQLAEEMIIEMKGCVSITQQIQHKDLSKAFADMYYGLNHEGQNDYEKLKTDFQLITDRALRLEHQCLYPEAAFDEKSAVYDHLQEDYRSYKDKGNLKNRIEVIKKEFQSVKLAMNDQVSKAGLGKAYRRLANESFMMITDSQRKINELQHTEIKKQEQFEKKIKPKSPLIGSNGNIFNLMGVATHTLKDAGMHKEAEEMFERITKSGSYDEALNIMMEYVEPIEVQTIERKEMSQQMA